MAILYVGIDLAKNVFAVHAVDGAGKPALVKPSVRRADLLELIAKLAPCVIGMEVCSGVDLSTSFHQGSGTGGRPTCCDVWPMRLLTEPPFVEWGRISRIAAPV